MASRLKDRLPWTSSPLIVNAPMGGFAGPDLATAVTKSGGLGQIGAIFDMKQLAAQLAQASDSLRSDGKLDCSKTLPIGVGLLPFILKIENVLPVLSKFNPAVVWLFAAKELEDYSTWTAEIRKSCPHSQIWIQIGSAAGAVEIAKSCKPDALILQGIDAGGHGFEKGAGIISLLPEAADTLAIQGFGHIPLLAAGGIVDGRGVAAALSLGAQGVVLGTRFLAAKETIVHPKYQEALLAANDGGQNTVRAKVFDELRGPNIWPVAYDGRGLVTNSYTDHANGVPIDQIRKLHTQALEEKDLGWGEINRATVWAGTGVGMVKRIQSAAEIVEEVRKGAKEALEAVRAR
jgi:nitronate monooxygenase